MALEGLRSATADLLEDQASLDQIEHLTSNSLNMVWDQVPQMDKTE